MWGLWSPLDLLFWGQQPGPSLLALCPPHCSELQHHWLDGLPRGPPPAGCPPQAQTPVLTYERQRTQGYTSQPDPLSTPPHQRDQMLGTGQESLITMLSACGEISFLWEHNRKWSDWPHTKALRSRPARLLESNAPVPTSTSPGSLGKALDLT